MEDILNKIHDYSLEDIMGDRFGRYAKAIIQDRAIPDVRDGLKPVQRRILYGMYHDHNTFDKPTRKSAKTVGYIMGNFHPHGDSSIYDAMVRMSQWWKQSTPYVDMQGNNGSMDGDGAAAMRYTEARLAKISNELLGDIDKDTVMWAPNFDDTCLEPITLPAKFPNLLVNGANGISAGYATNIPTHNLSEVIDATIKRIDNPNCRLETILDIVKGPDFPTGGIVEGKSGIIDAFTTGRGRVIVKAKVDFVREKGKDQIVVSEIPFDVNKATLVNKIDSIRIEKKIDGMSEVRDESDRNNPVRIVIDLKKDANKDFVLNYLYKNTDLQISYNYNMVAIVNRRPMTLGILPILDAYIDFQREVITRRTNFDLRVYEKRLHIVEGFLKMLSILDEVIKIIRGSKNKSDAKVNLIEKYAFSEEQAEAIVMLQLYRLTNTDVYALEEENKNLCELISKCKEILGSEEKLKEVMKSELREVKKNYGYARHTEIRDEITDVKIDIKDVIPNEKVVVVVTNDGYVKKVPEKSFKSSDEETLLKPGDYILSKYLTTTQDTLMLFTNLGNYLFVPIHKIAECKWKELGKHISNTIVIKENEKIIGSLIYKNSDEEISLFTKNGLVKQVKYKDFEVSRASKPMTAIKLKEADELINISDSKNETLFITNNGYYLRFKTNEIPVVGVKASGVKGINLKDDYCIYGTSFDDKDEYLNIITNQKTFKRLKISDLATISRAKKGNMLFKKVKTKDYKIAYAYLTDSKDINIYRDDSELYEIKNSDIPIMDLASVGSNIKFKYDLFVIKKDIIKTNNEQVTEDSSEEEIKEEVKEEQLSFSSFVDDFKI